MPDVTCLGELLTDFISTTPDLSLAEAPVFAKSPGGAPANVACGLARLGVASAFLGMVGADPFGDYLKSVLSEVGVDTRGLRQTTAVRTTLAFIATHSDGHKDVTFYPHAGADTLLDPGSICEPVIRESRVFHFGSVGLRHEPTRSGTLHAIGVARDAGCLISYDPNFRPALWQDLEEAREWILRGMAHADLVKVADEEWEFITGCRTPEEGMGEVLSRGPRLVIVTEAERGASWYTSKASGHVPAFPVQVVDPLGAGDAFNAAVLSKLCRRGLEPLPSAEEMQAILTYANAAGALTTQKVGVIPALPTDADVVAFMRQHGRG